VSSSIGLPKRTSEDDGRKGGASRLFGAACLPAKSHFRSEAHRMPTLLERLMSRAIVDPREETAFFQALMKATVYAHIPVSDHIEANSDRVRFIQFHRPDNGQLVLPFFTDEEKARFAAQSAAQVIAMNGRLLLELTRGATLMMDPNDCRCVLYPEEVEGLLRKGRIATIQKFTVQEGAEPQVGPAQDSPAWLIDGLIPELAKLSFVQAAYLAGVYRNNAGAPEQTGLVIALEGEEAQAERAVHAVAAVAQPLCEAHNSVSLDLTHFDATIEVPSWISGLALQPFYDRSWGARLHQQYGRTSPAA